MALFGGRKDDRGLKAGFREMKWGEAPRPGMILLEETGDDRHCMLAGDDLEFGGAALERIIYKYFQKRLAEVQIEIPPASADAVFRHLAAEWGKPQQPNRFIEDFNCRTTSRASKGRSPRSAGTRTRRRPFF